MLIAWLSSRLRLVDVLRSYIRHGGYAPDGTLIIQVIAKFSKDGHPIDIYIRAGGPLGDWEWAEEHIQQVQNWKYCLPAFESPGFAGDVTRATRILPRVVSRQHAMSSLIAITSMAPLGATKEVWAELTVSGHSAHGSCDDAVPYRYKFCYRFRSSTTSVLGRTAPSLHLTELVSHHERDRYGKTNSDFVPVQYGMYVNRPHRCNEYNG